MKMPSAVGRSGGGIGDLFLQHGEKLGFLVIALVGGWLMWGGISAILTKRPSAEMLPTVIKSQADSAEQHVRQSTPLPEDKKTSGDVGEVTGQLAAWSSPAVQPAAEFAMLNKPLFNAFEKRTKPDVFPVEDLHVEAGVAVLPKPGRGGMPGMPGGFPGSGRGPMGMGPQGFSPDDFSGEMGPAEEGMLGDAGPGGFGGGLTPTEESGSGEEGGFGGFPGMGSGGFGRPGMGGPPGMGFGRGRGTTPGDVVPYVVVTGLVPYGKQMTEYEVRYGQSSYRDPQRDTPKWDLFLVERAEDDGSGTLNWQRIDTRAAADEASRQWSPSPELLPPDCVLSAFDVPELGRSQQMVSPYAYNMPLPSRLDGSWGAEAIHPWFQAFLEQRRDEQRAMEAAMGRGSEGGPMGMRGGMGSGMMSPGMGSGSGGMGYGMGSSMGSGMGSSMGSGMGSSMGPAGMGSGRGMRGMMGSGMGSGMGMEGGFGGGGSIFTEDDGNEPGGEGMMGMGEDQMFMQPAPVEYRLFRFIDTDVEPGKTYRYRVRVSLWNPNIKLHPQYLASEDVATPTKLASEPSEPSEAVRVPQPALLLARTLDRAEARKVRGLVEALVLGPHPETGNFSLRSVSLDRGGMANVAEQDGNVRDRGTQGEPITTDSMLVDVMGTQEKPDERRRDKDDRVPEPLDMLFMRPDGSLDVVSAADTERKATQYLPTLGGNQDPRAGQNGPQRGQPGFGPGGFRPGSGSSPFGGGSSSPFGGGSSSPFGGGSGGPFGGGAGGSSPGGYGGGYGGGERP